MKGFKRKQVVVLSLVLMIVVAGYLQYSYKSSSFSAEKNRTGEMGEAVYVDSTTLEAEETEGQGLDLSYDIPVSQDAEEFFAQAKLDKEITLSRDTDMLKQITEDVNASAEIKAEAYEKMISLVDRSQIESKIETLIRERGFKDAIALLGSEGSIDIIVKTPSLTSAETAQIADIASRHANIEIENIRIKNIY
jgi:stage III sporulation protein AH